MPETKLIAELISSLLYTEYSIIGRFGQQGVISLVEEILFHETNDNSDVEITEISQKLLIYQCKGIKIKLVLLSRGRKYAGADAVFRLHDRDSSHH